MTDAMREYLAQRHPRAACPCRKRHIPARKPELPPLLPGMDPKAAKRYRRAIEDLDEAQDVEDDFAVRRAERKVADQEAVLGAQGIAYRGSFDAYRAAKAEWRNDTCAGCGVSILCPAAAPGCPRCMTEFEEMAAAVAP